MKFVYIVMVLEESYVQTAMVQVIIMKNAHLVMGGGKYC